MQKTLFIKLSIIAGLCVLFGISLNMIGSLIFERQNYSNNVIAEIAQQHVNPQEVITPFVAIPTTITPVCQIDKEAKDTKCPASYTKLDTVFANQTQASQDLTLSTDTYKRGIYHATSYTGDLTFKQSYLAPKSYLASNSGGVLAGTSKSLQTMNKASADIKTSQTVFTHWQEARLIIPVSDLRGITALPQVTINGQKYTATYPEATLLEGLSYVELVLPDNVTRLLDPKYVTSDSNTNTNTDTSANAVTATLSVNNGNTIGREVNQQLENSVNSAGNTKSTSANHNNAIQLNITLPISGISKLNTVPTGQNFELAMTSNWHAPNFIGKALPNAKNITDKGFSANWQNQYLTVANNQKVSQCLSKTTKDCRIISRGTLDNVYNDYNYESRYVMDSEAAETTSASSVQLNSFGVSFAEPNDVYLQTERTMKYALLLILVSFGTFFLFEVIKSSPIHPIQYLLVGCALVIFYVLLLPLAEQVAFWKAYAISAAACVGLIGMYSFYMLGTIKRAAAFTAVLAGLYVGFYGILTSEDLNLLLGAIFCFILLACVMILTRKIDWYKVA